MKFLNVKTVVGLGVVGAAVIFTTACSGGSPAEAGLEQVVPEKSPVAVAAIPATVKQSLPAPEPANSKSDSVTYEAGTLLKSNKNTRVYYITDTGARRSVKDHETFVAYGFQPQEVLIADDDTVLSLPTAEPLTRFALDDNNHLYWVNNGERVRVNQWKSIVDEPTSRLDSSLQKLLPVRRLKSGSFVRHGNMVHYFLQDKLIWVPEEAYNGVEVVEMPPGLFQVYPTTHTLNELRTKLSVNTQAANVRNGPGLGFEVLGVIDNTQTILVNGRAENSNWLQVEYNGSLAWLAGDLIAHQYLLDALPVVSTSDLVPETKPMSLQQPKPSNTYIGIGARLGTKDGWPAIEASFVDSPADRAGLQPGDMILAVDGQNITHLSLGEVANRIRGEIGVPVTISVSRPNIDQQMDIVVVRGEIDLLKTREVCVALPIRGFGETWKNHPEVREWLGCPFTNFRRDEHATPAAVQTFERGWMLWLETDTVANVDPIYVFFEDDHSYIRYGDRPLVDAHSYFPTPRGYNKVGDRFAKVYWEEFDHRQRARLGFAVNEARDSNGAFQEFENGRMFWAGQADTIYSIYQGYFDVNGDGQITWTQGWNAYEDTFEESSQ